MSATNFRILSDATLQAELERMLKARRDAEAVRAARFRKLSSQPDDTDSPLPAMLLWAVAGLAAWAVFGWGVVELIRAFTGITP